MARSPAVSATGEVLLAAAIVIFDAHVLLVRRSEKESFLPRRWGVPCGKLDEGETPAEAARRELREETRLDERVGSWVGRLRFESPDRRSGRAPLRNVQENFLVHAEGRGGKPPEVEPPETDQLVKWVAIDKLSGIEPPEDDRLVPIEPDLMLDGHNLKAIQQAAVSLATG